MWNDSWVSVSTRVRHGLHVVAAEVERGRRRRAALERRPSASASSSAHGRLAQARVVGRMAVGVELDGAPDGVRVR